MLNPLFAIVGALLGVGGNIDYVLGTASGRIRPNLVSWSLWSLPPLIGLMCELSGGAGLEAMLTLTLAVGPLAVVAVSLASRNAQPSAITTLDRSCGALSLATIVLWMVTRNADAALALAIVTDALAAVPTIVKTYREPKSESPKAFALFCASGAVTLLTIREWTMVSVAYPSYILALSASILALTVLPSRNGGRGLERTATA
jgi:hypothetical protein